MNLRISASNLPLQNKSEAPQAGSAPALSNIRNVPAGLIADFHCWAPQPLTSEVDAAPVLLPVTVSRWIKTAASAYFHGKLFPFFVVGIGRRVYGLFVWTALVDFLFQLTPLLRLRWLDKYASVLTKQGQLMQRKIANTYCRPERFFAIRSSLSGWRRSLGSSTMAAVQEMTAANL